MVEEYVPKRGDVVWLEFSDAVGSEQKGHRPALILSPYEYNKKIRLCLACPITSKVKGYSYEVPIKFEKISGVVLANQVTSFSFSSRSVRLIGFADKATVFEVAKKINFLIS